MKRRTSEGKQIEIRNDARRAALSGRPCLNTYSTGFDPGRGLIDMDTYQQSYFEKWGGAPWIEELGTDKVIILDNAPASSPDSSTLASTISSTTSSRRTTLEER
jgi:hypothetical protein